MNALNLIRQRNENIYKRILRYANDEKIVRRKKSTTVKCANFFDNKHFMLEMSLLSRILL